MLWKKFLYVFITFNFHQSIIAQIDVFGECTGDNFGYSIGVSGDGTRIVVGATLNDGYYLFGCNPETDINKGRTKVFDFNGSDWIQAGFDIDGLSENARSGSSVDISEDGNIIIIGERLEHDGRGQARIFEWDSANQYWNQKGGNIEGHSADGNFGTAVSISADGSKIAIGEPYALTGFLGVTNVYEWQDVAWILVSSIPGTMPYEYSGQALDLSEDGSRIVIGSYGYDEQRGAAKVFQVLSTGHAFIGQVLGEELDILFGYTVSISGDGQKIVVGAPYGDSGAETYDGSVQTFEYQVNHHWHQFSPTIYGDSTMSGFGSSVSMSNDGSVIAVGADIATNQVDQKSGKVFSYQWDGVQWNQFENIFEGSSDLEGYGRIVDISADGTTVAIGAPRNDETGMNAGRASVGYISPNLPFNIVCMDITANLDVNGEVNLQGIAVDGGSTSPNGIQSYSVAPNFFNCDVIGNHNVILTVVDNEGLSDTCTAVVTIADENLNCCYPNFDLDDDPIPNHHYKSITFISSSGTIPSSGSVTFDAGSVVILNPGFKVELGGVLHCLQDGCNP